MWAVLAAIAFAVALILHLVGHGVAKYVIDFELAGFILIALHLAFPWNFAWARRAAPPA